MIYHHAKLTRLKRLGGYQNDIFISLDALKRTSIELMCVKEYVVEKHPNFKPYFEVKKWKNMSILTDE